jgi:FGGY-family pentulose kinase
MEGLVVGVDVGTASVRAGVFSASGELLGRAETPIAMRRRSAREAEHDSEDIWRAAARTTREALRSAHGRAKDVVAIAFDATCSLVVRGRQGEQIPVGGDTDSRWDTITWFDHRALAEAEQCTATQHEVLDNIGGSMSPEMQIPKLMWLKRHLPRSWAAMGGAFDLVDYLSFRASGSRARSISTLASKWCWRSSRGWPHDFHARLDLADLLDKMGWAGDGRAAGADLGPLTPSAALALGLTTRARVAAGSIDAHAGALAVLGARASSLDSLDRHSCLIAGSSSSVLALAAAPRFVPGVWGPTENTILPGLWLYEAGQSASGALLDHVVRGHPAGGNPSAARHRDIAARIAVLLKAEGPDFAAGLHVLPDFHGNRSPLAEPAALGVISGLGLDTDFDSLCRLYWRTAVALALGIRQNLEALCAHDLATDTLLLAGGHGRTDLLVSLYADATGCSIVEPSAPDAMLLGSAMLAATAAGLYPSLSAAAAGMDQGGRHRPPNRAMKAVFERDYRIFLEMQRQRRVLEGMERQGLPVPSQIVGEVEARIWSGEVVSRWESTIRGDVEVC